MEITIEDIVKMRSEGQTYKQIAEVAGVHPLTVAKWYRQEVTPRALNSKGEVMRATAARVRRDRKNGLAYATIAFRYETTKKVVKDLLSP